MNTYLIIKNSVVTNKIAADSPPPLNTDETLKLDSDYNYPINMGDIYDVGTDSFKDSLEGNIYISDQTSSFSEDGSQEIFYNSSTTASIQFTQNVNTISVENINVDKGVVTSISTINNICNIIFDVNSNISGSENPIQLSIVGSITSPDVPGNAIVDPTTFYYTSGSDLNPYIYPDADA
tara:strand:- start:473 stop:1009 length:537 start_codon:yes stop_codon:yes gene_type:complete